jgi:hypothetical protein
MAVNTFGHNGTNARREMTEEISDIITMTDMAQVFDVTDTFGIDRESISVELSKEDPGLVEAGDGGTLQITLPLSTPLDAWASTFKEELQRLGYTKE